MAIAPQGRSLSRSTIASERAMSERAMKEEETTVPKLEEPTPEPDDGPRASLPKPEGSDQEEALKLEGDGSSGARDFVREC